MTTNTMNSSKEIDWMAVQERDKQRVAHRFHGYCTALCRFDVGHTFKLRYSLPTLEERAWSGRLQFTDVLDGFKLCMLGFCGLIAEWKLNHPGSDQRDECFDEIMSDLDVDTMNEKLIRSAPRTQRKRAFCDAWELITENWEELTTEAQATARQYSQG